MSGKTKRRGIKKKSYFNIVYYVPLIIGATIILIPIIWMSFGSFRPGPEIFAYPLRLWPKEFIIRNYLTLFETVPFARNFLNSVIATGGFLILTLFLCSLAGFAFAKYRFPLRNTLFIILLGSMMIPIHVILIPLFLLMLRIGWVNTLYALIIPLAAHPIGLFFMRQYMLSIPSELMDAARIDGCSEFGIFYKIVLPVCKPALGALAILLGLEQWNYFLWPLVVLSSSEKLTLPIAIANLIEIFEEKPEFGVIFAGCLLSILPILILFLFLQKYFMSGALRGAIKG